MVSILSSLPIFSSLLSDWLNALIYAVMAVLFVSNIKKDKKTLLLLGIRCVVAYACYLLIDILIRLLMKPIPEDIYPIVDNLTAYFSFFVTPLLTSLLVCLFIKDLKWSTRIIMSSLLITSWILLPSIHMYLISFFQSRSTWLVILPRLLILSLMLILLKRFNINKFSRLNVWPIMIFESFTIVEISIECVAHFRFDINILNYLAFIIWVVEIFVYLFFYMFLKSNNEKREQLIENQKLKNDMKLMSFMKANYENMRLLKHDMKNQYSYISILYDQGKDEEAKQFFSQIALAADKVLNFASTGNSVLDLTLNMALSKAKEENVDFEYVCSCPSETRFLESDFFSLLINLFDNAIEGSGRNQEAKKKVVSHIYLSGNYLIIDTYNTIDKNIDENTLKAIKTSKSNKKEHGYGKKIIQTIVKKYDGDILVTIHEGIYEVKVMLALKDEDTIKQESKNEIDKC